MKKFFLVLCFVCFNTAAYAAKELRISIVGDSAVGKTALLDQLRGRDFNENTMISVGIDYTTLKSVVGLEDIRFVVFDIPGAPYFRNSVSRIVKNNLDGALIVFDLTNMESFLNVQMWIRKIRSISPKTPIILIGNKADYEEDRVFTHQLIELTRKNGIEYFETSAKTGPGLREPLKQLARRARNSHHDSIRNISTPQSLDEDIYFKALDHSPLDMLNHLFTGRSELANVEASLSDYFFHEQLSHQHLINNALAGKLKNYISFCLKNISEVRKLEHKMTKITHYRIFSFIVSLGINLSIDSEDLFELLYNNLQKQDLQYLCKILFHWDSLINSEYKDDFYLMDYLKVENDFQLLLSSAKKISYEILNCSRWGDEQEMDVQELLMSLENLSTISLQRIVKRLRSSPDGETIVGDIIEKSQDIDSPFFRSGGRYASLSDLICEFIKEPRFE